jgi:sec-independent protein translocase protein TatA
MMGLDNPLHIAFLLVILLLVFGAKRLPEMGRSLGSGLRGFKESISGEIPATHLSAEADAIPGERLTTSHAANGTSEPVAERSPFGRVA